MLCSLFLPYINYVTLYECEHNQLVSFNTNPHWDNQSYTKKNEKERKLFDLVDYDRPFIPCDPHHILTYHKLDTLSI